MRILLQGGTIINEGRTFKGDLLIHNDRIEKIIEGELDSVPGDIKVIDATGKYVIPGVIDDQVHFREPGLTHKGDIREGSRAAAAGGVTSFMDMPNVKPPTVTNELLREKQQIAKENAAVNYSFYLGATVDNIDEIIEAADGIMIARGDMGVEIPAEDVPHYQKEIIKKCNATYKPVITATQMLDSMIRNPRPTRAEATDVANAIYDGTDAIMLSGETAKGKYPVEAVKMMARIAERTEKEINYRKRFNDMAKYTDPGITDAICHATCSTAYDLDAKAIITVTKSGFSARMISKYRPGCDIIGCAMDEKVCRQLNLSWGVRPILLGEEWEVFVLFERAINACKRDGLLEKGDVTVITSGVPIGRSGTTNMLKVQVVDD